MLQVVIRVADVMSKDMVVVPAWFSAADAAGERRGRHRSYPVVDARGATIGVVDPAALAGSEVPMGATYGEICRPVSSLPVVAPDDDIDQLFRMPAVIEGFGALVIHEDRLVGVVSPGYLLRLRRARAELFQISGG
jgi:CBS domain-containing protein